MIDCRCRLASIFPPQIHQKSFKNNFQKASFFHRFWHRFLYDFGSVLGPKLAPRRRLFRSKRGPMWHASAFFVALSFFSNFLASRNPFSKVFGCILAQFWKTSWLCLGSSFKPGALTDTELLDRFLCRRLPFVVRVVAGTRLAALMIT